MGNTDVVTPSPHYPKSNGLMERNVQTIKQLLKNQSWWFQARCIPCFTGIFNSPITGLEESPTMLLMSRKLRTKLPTAKHLLTPKRKPATHVCRRLLLHQKCQKTFYDHGTRSLPTLHQGDPVRIRQGREWMPAMVVKQHQAPRSYTVATPDGSRLRQSCIDLWPTTEATQVMSPVLEPASDEPSHPLPLNSEIGVEKCMAELQPS